MTYGHFSLLVVGILAISLVSQYFHGGLNKYPGPFIANFTHLWRFHDVLRRRPDITHLRLHRKFGDIVRLGPNVLSFADPNALKAIYGLNKGMSDFYPVQMSTSKGEPLPSLFSATDEKFHANLRRSVNNAFSMTSLVQYEPMINDTTQVFLDQTERLFAAEDKPCDFARWLQFFAFDVIGSITYSKRHGFIDKNEDVDDIVAQLARIFDYAGPIGQMPWLDKLLWKNPLLDWLSKWGLLDNSFAVAIFARARMQERFREATPIHGAGGSREDLLTMFMKTQKTKPDVMTEKRVLTMAVSMAFAGSETTAISLAAVFYFLLKQPSCLQRLRNEIDEAIRAGKLTDHASGVVSWTESQNLPYLDACIKEAFRMHPAAGLPLERVVPPQGMDICGDWIPGNTIVGCSAWVIHRQESVFGDDVDTFRPERWLDADPERLKLMNSAMFQFGAGSRTCIGKNISLMEIYKLVPSFLRRFDVSLFIDLDWDRSWFSWGHC
ncbi:Cytochrome P450 [Penicillium alfredii]|uniref:Cytochrome P450 n=1 Tax=Penicillium alfredii TaxID=1506179 RepID=A0A9W9ES95_9EURO|nr:Cytochrome P450 [Penicillium alfredii]KAJ5086944.1 Cytochrome P450 [Penicillium alfredii]